MPPENGASVSKTLALQPLSRDKKHRPERDGRFPSQSRKMQLNPKARKRSRFRAQSVKKVLLQGFHPCTPPKGHVPWEFLASQASYFRTLAEMGS